MSTNLKIEYINPTSLEQSPYNPRKWSEEALKGLRASISEFGIVDPFVINKRRGLRLVGGHMRCQVAIELGIEKVPIIFVDLSDKKEKALNVALNSKYISGDWDASLGDLLGEIQADLPDLFDNLNFEDLLADVPEIEFCPPEGETDADEVPELAAEPVIKSGDLVILGRHRLLCGNSCNAVDVERLMDGKMADRIIFDPPYDEEHLYNDIPMQKAGQKLVVFWDFKRFGIASHQAILHGWNPLYEFIWDNITSWYTPNRPLARHKACGVFGDNLHFNFDIAIINDGKDRGNPRTVKNSRSDCEYVPLVGAKHISTVEQFRNLDKLYIHSKPFEWIKAIYEGIGGETFLDLFGGSGVTMAVCEKMNKTSFTIEKDPAITQLIIQRWINMTNNSEIVLNGEKQIWSELVRVQ